MNVSIKRIQAIFVKDYKEFYRNYAISTMVLMPLALAFIYSMMGDMDLQSLFMPINLTFAMITAFIQSCLIAEEKEHNTLRSLLLSPASIADILIGKSSLVFLITVIVLGLCMWMLDFRPSNLMAMSSALVLSTVFYLAMGLIVGLYTKTVMEASVGILPVMIVFSFGPLVLLFADRYPILEVFQWLPSAQLILLEQHSAAGTTSDVIMSLVVLAVWAVVGVVISAILFKKRMSDE
ncbi:ABC transporter [Chryseomicrobium excrementi]|uniref:ABC transporter n=1 Tax=Chryseomicrobium excrementi TaxID=2041346 RepID=A0A2M9EXQ4_9BACL|nr:ABC transporter permease [Chryseomicrobium excrementi]PJK15986.1 ABC transporter [Chryseomicrobium excrementi]